MNTLTWPLIVSIIAILAGIYFIIASGTSKKKIAMAGAGNGNSSFAATALLMTKHAEFPQLIDKPGLDDAGSQEVELKDSYEEEGELEFMETEDSRLLKEAEQVVTEIQDVVNNIASYPPNQEEVRSKVRNILKQYHIFKNTEYFEAINNFVILTVERDCKITFRQEELPALWN